MTRLYSMRSDHSRILQLTYWKPDTAVHTFNHSTYEKACGSLEYEASLIYIIIFRTVGARVRTCSGKENALKLCYIQHGVKIAFKSDFHGLKD